MSTRIENVMYGHSSATNFCEVLECFNSHEAFRQ